MTNQSQSPFVIAVGMGIALLPILMLSCGVAPPPDAAFYEPAVALSTNIIAIGDPVTARITVRHATNESLSIGVPERDGLRVLSRDTASDVLSEHVAVTEIRLRFTSLETGGITLFGTNAVIHRADGEDRNLFIPAANIEVRSVLDADTEFRDIKEPVRWPGRVPRWIGVLAVAALLAAVAAWFLHRVLTRPRTLVNMPPPPPPHETAYRALDQLLRKGYIERGEVKPFYTELSDIVRRYLEDRFLLRAPEQTTEEFIRAAGESDALNANQRALTGAFLEQADLVKFARYTPDSGNMRDAAAAARRLVDETRPAPEGAAP